MKMSEEPSGSTRRERIGSFCLTALLTIAVVASVGGLIWLLYDSMNRYEQNRDSLFCFQHASSIGIDFDQCMKARR